jgi:flagellar protein FlaF
LLLQAAARLQSVHDGWGNNKTQLDEALRFNRKLWSIFLSEMTDGTNPMPREVRQNVANLGLFVMNHTVSVMNDPRPERLNSLIKINRELAAGLLGQGA